jgi:hypothetical protein
MGMSHTAIRSPKYARRCVPTPVEYARLYPTQACGPRGLAGDRPVPAATADTLPLNPAWVEWLMNFPRDWTAV